MTLINTKRVAEILEFSNPGTIYVISKRDKNFPKPKETAFGKSNGGAYLYCEDEIRAYKETRKSKRKRSTHIVKNLAKGEIDTNLSIDFLKRARP